MRFELVINLKTAQTLVFLSIEKRTISEIPT
jgi:hypothetical protein